MPASTQSRRRARPAAPEIPAVPGARDAWLALLVCAALALFWSWTLSDARAWGWDESMHAELPAARMLVALKQGEPGQAHRALLECQQYPFVWPLMLCAVQAVTDISEHATRVAGTLAWCAALFGLFLLGRELATRLEPRPRGARWLAWALLALGALSPLCLAFAGTLFLEVPFACALAWTLRAWVRRDGSATRELAAGEWLTIAFFTKFNYGLLLCGGLGLAWLAEAVAARGELGRFARRSLVLALVPLVAALWWFVLANGPEHRAAFLEFLNGNRAFAPTPCATRWMHAALSLHLGPIVCALVLVLALVALVRLRASPVRALACVALALIVPSWLHPFHLDRFLIPQALALWSLAALGFALLAWPLRLATLALFAVGATGLGREACAERLGYLSADPKTREYQRAIYASWRDLSGARPLPTHGLERTTHDALAAAIVRCAGPRERVSWIGMWNQFSPAALHLARLSAGMDPQLFLAEAPRRLDLDYFGPGPQETDLAGLADLAHASDVVLYGTPSDLGPKRERDGLLRQAQALQNALGWQAREIARISVEIPLRPPLEASLFACRPKP